LDPIAADEFLRTIHKINQDLGTTIILSEHRLEAALTMADKVIVMDQGRVLSADSPRRIGRLLTARKQPMFYGLPAITKIFYAAGATGDSPLTIREGRLWIETCMRAFGVPAADNTAIWQGIAPEQKPEKCKDPAIRLDHVWFSYERNNHILKDLTLDVPKGELFCILGGNGVGKSTMLKLIGGILQPRRGKGKVSGRFVMLPQNPQALFTEITCEDELLEGMHGMRRSVEEKAAAVTAMLRLMEIQHLAKAHPYDLYGGEQQRLALGKVLLQEPDVVLLDEATKGLDPFFKITLAQILRKLTAQRRDHEHLRHGHLGGDGGTAHQLGDPAGFVYHRASL
jgi:energy-coupling factor transport system ATP-binding protein